MQSLPALLDTESLYGRARGKMFGVLVCKTEEGNELVLKAFSGQYEGQWEIEGWVPPLFDVQVFNTLNIPKEREIKALSRQLKNPSLPEEERGQLHRKRKELSQKLMLAIHRLYRLHNFNNQQCSLPDLFPEGTGIPTGTGDCCAPKLLNHAARNDLQPVAIAEFYWGKSNKSHTRHEAQFYPACTDKCGPILGFLLCGINQTP